MKYLRHFFYLLLVCDTISCTTQKECDCTSTYWEGYNARINNLKYDIKDYNEIRKQYSVTFYDTLYEDDGHMSFFYNIHKSGTNYTKVYGVATWGTNSKKEFDEYLQNKIEYELNLSIIEAILRQ